MSRRSGCTCSGCWASGLVLMIVLIALLGAGQG